jgi:magnesium-dependent phosphatase 1
MERQPQAHSTEKDPSSDAATVGRHPKLIVFDLDNTIWTPELYQIRRYTSSPRAHRDVRLFPGARIWLDRIRDPLQKQQYFPNIQFAIASRTKSVEIAHDLLDQFGIRDIFDYIEIFPGDKTRHFENIRRASGREYHEMIFLDDARDGRYGNCVPVSSLGVLAVHCQHGLHEYEILERALQFYATWDPAPGTIIEHDGRVTLNNHQNINLSTAHKSTIRNSQESGGGVERSMGRIKYVNHEKRYGFLQLDSRGNESSSSDLFFHFNQLRSPASAVKKGDSFSFIIAEDSRTGRSQANDLRKNGSATESTSTPSQDNVSSQEKDATITDSITMSAFSMNMPFAALLANGHKTLETRNHDMFARAPSVVLLHVGHRTYPDGNKHIKILRESGLSESEIQSLKSLPPSYERGMLVAVCELGSTTHIPDPTERDRKRQAICAYGVDSGTYVTEIRRVQYLRKPVPFPAKGGIFSATIDATVLPDGWTISNENNAKQNHIKPFYSISG